MWLTLRRARIQKNALLHHPCQQAYEVSGRIKQSSRGVNPGLL